MDKAEKEAIVKRAFELGFRYEREHRGCAQCAILAIQEALGIRDDSVYQAGSGLAGGGGECIDGSCGGYSGGTMMMSLLFGRSRQEAATKQGRADKYESFHMASALHERFVERYGGVVCSHIQKTIFGRSFDLRDDRQKEEFRAAGAHHDDDKCCAVVGNGAQWAAGLILDQAEKKGLSIEELRRSAGSQEG